MDRTTALSTAGAFTLTSVAAVSALFMTMDRGAQAASEGSDPAIMQPQIVTDYEYVQAPPEAPVEVVTEASTAEIAAPAPVSQPTQDDHHEHEYEEHDDD